MDRSEEDIDIVLDAGLNQNSNKSEKTKAKGKKESEMTFDIKAEMEEVQKINHETFALLKQRLNLDDDEATALCAVTGLADLNQITEQIEKLKLGVKF